MGKEYVAKRRGKAEIILKSLLDRTECNAKTLVEKAVNDLRNGEKRTIVVQSYKSVGRINVGELDHNYWDNGLHQIIDYAYRTSPRDSGTTNTAGTTRSFEEEGVKVNILNQNSGRAYSVSLSRF